MVWVTLPAFAWFITVMASLGRLIYPDLTLWFAWVNAFGGKRLFNLLSIMMCTTKLLGLRLMP